MPYLHSFVIVWFHSPEFHKSQEDAAKKPVMVSAWDPDGGEDSSSSAYFCDVSNSRENAPKEHIMVPPWNLDAGESYSASVYFCSNLNSPEDAPKKLIMVPLWNLHAGENSSASVYFCGISCGNKITPVEKDGKADKRWVFSLGRSVSPYSLHLSSNMGKGVGSEKRSKTEVSTRGYRGDVLQEQDTVSLLTVP
jgi:hypothetical protein